MITFTLDNALGVFNLNDRALKFFGLLKSQGIKSQGNKSGYFPDVFMKSVLSIGDKGVDSCDISNAGDCMRILISELKKNHYVILGFTLNNRTRYLLAYSRSMLNSYSHNIEIEAKSFTNLSQANDQLLFLGMYYGNILDSSIDAFVLVDSKGQIIMSNSVFDEKFTDGSGLESGPLMLIDFAATPEVATSILDKLRGSENEISQWPESIAKDVMAEVVEVILKDKNSEKLTCDMRIVPSQDGNVFSNGKRYCVWIQDNTSHKINQNQLEAVYLHDQLTGLPSRKLFAYQLNVDMIEHQSKGIDTAVLFIDVDRFKGINDSLGHEAGDKVIELVSSRIKNCLGPNQFLARFGGDEFILSMSGKNIIQKAVKMAARIIGAFGRPIEFDDNKVYSSLSIGIASNAEAGYDANTLISNADTAMFEAKRKGGHRFELFNELLKEKIVQSTAFEMLLHSAIEKDELKVYFQPLIGLPSLKTVGVEALIRWQHPTKGLIMPDSFIKTAEDTGLIIPIGEFVLKEACKTMDRWVTSDELLQPFDYEDRLNSVVEVNLSAKQIDEPNLIKTVEEALSESNLSPNQLVLEITEGAQMEDHMKALEVFNQLRAMGIKLAVDDFGTGFSSLTYLRSFPFDILKIDKSFVSVLSERPEDSIIVKTVIDLSHSLGLEVVAEGVETKLELDILTDLGCDMAQGFLFSKPVSAHDLEHSYSS